MNPEHDLYPEQAMNPEQAWGPEQAPFPEQAMNPEQLFRDHLVANGCGNVQSSLKDSNDDDEEEEEDNNDDDDRTCGSAMAMVMLTATTWNLDSNIMGAVGN